MSIICLDTLSTRSARAQALRVGATGHRARPGTVVAATVALCDALALGVAVALLWSEARTWTLPAFSAGALLLLSTQGQYRRRIALSMARDIRPVVVSMLLPVLAVALGGGMGPTPVGRVLRLLAWSAGLALLGRFFAYGVIKTVRARGRLAERTLLVGAGQMATQLAQALTEHPEYGLAPIGFLDDVAPSEQAFLSLPLLGGVEDLHDVLGKERVGQVILAFGRAREAGLIEVVRACEDASVDIRVLPRFFELGCAPRHRVVDEVWGYPLVRVQRSVLRMYPRIAKRTFDLVVASLALLLLSPLYLALALGVRLTSRGPVYFRQQRVGKRGTVVEVLKFRSMRVNDDSDTQWSVDKDDRVTALGRVMRDLSLDELPQLWNVVRGDMSLVGPRPERPHFVEQFGATVRHYDSRHRVPVGLTGLAQVHGLRGDTSIGERARLDNQYIENWSFWQDVVILGQTAGAVLRHAGDAVAHQRRHRRERTARHSIRTTAVAGWSTEPETGWASGATGPSAGRIRALPAQRDASTDGSRVSGSDGYRSPFRGSPADAVRTRAARGGAR